MEIRKNVIQTMLLAFLFTGTSISCKELKDSFGSDSIDLTDLSHPVASLPLSDAVADLTIVPLETNEQSIIKEIRKLIVTDEEIFVADQKQVLRFAPDGKFLNLIGASGEGPGEYSYITDIQFDTANKKLYVLSSNERLQTYSPEGYFIEKLNDKPFSDNFAGMGGGGFLLIKQLLFWQDGLPIRPDKQTIWNYALTDNSGKITKTFTNPAYQGHEQEIIENHALYQGWKNYWTEPGNSLDFYNGEFNLLYYGVDTIYRYDDVRQEFIPRYTLNINGHPSFEASRQWIKEMSFWQYTIPEDFFETKDFLYLVAGKSSGKYLVKFDKQTGEVAYTEQKGTIKETKFPNGFLFTRREVENPGFTNDICGLQWPFVPKKQTNGAYWTCLYEASDLLENKELTTQVTKPASRDKLLQIINTLKEDDNPVVMIAKLK
ncbi:MAG: 6-bladed beta-propeller [Tannerella sp.]|jgi:hypothetical protein|nr:6-bladed beta-propeller [Tannerella sp.]